MFSQAHGLLNSCLVRCTNEEDKAELRLKLFELERCWYDGNHPLRTPEGLQDTTARLKTKLGEIRDGCKQRFEDAGGLINNFNMEDLFCEENKEHMRHFAGQVNEVSQICTELMIGFSKAICETSEEVVGHPTESYAMVALGSIARNEATPYSDLEYAFIVANSADKTYFHRLAMDTYFRISNLGETPLKYLYIEELYDEYRTEDEKRWFDDQAMSGFKIDGLLPKAGNIPTGNGLSDANLTLTVEELMQHYQACMLNSVTSAESDIVGDLSDLLASLVLVHAPNGGEVLLDEFLMNKMITDEEISGYDGGREVLERKRVKTLLKDVDKYKFCSDPGELKIDMRSVEIKSDIFRYPTILAHDIKIILDYSNCTTAWEVYSTLQKKGIINEETLHMFQFILTAAIWTRTMAYLVGNTQREYLSFHPKFDMCDRDDRFFIPKSLFITMACHLIPLKQSVLRHLIGADPSIQAVHKSLREIDTGNIHFLIQGRIRYSCGDFRGSLQVLHRALGKTSTDSISNLLDATTMHNISHEDMADLILLSLFQNGYYAVTIELCNYLHDYEERKAPPISHLNIAFYRAIKGQCLMMQGLYSEQAEEFDKAGKSLVNHFGKNKTVALFSVLSLLSAGGGTPEGREALERLKTLAFNGLCVNLCFISDSVRYHQGRHEKFRESRQSLLDSYTLVKQLVIKENINSLINGDFLMSFGVYYLQDGEYSTAVRYLESADSIYKNIYGSSAASVELSTIKLYLSYVTFKRGNYTAARELCRDALDVLRESEQGSPAHFLTNHQIMAEILTQKGEYDRAQQHISQCLRLLQEQFEDRPILSKAVVQITQAQLIYGQTRDGDLPLEHKYAQYDFASDLLQTAIVILQSTVNKKHVHTHPDISLSYKLLGKICMEMNNVDRATGYLMMAEDGFIIAYNGEERPHVDLADTLYWSGLVKVRQDDASGARLKISRAIGMMERIFGEGQPHPVTDQYRNQLHELGPARGYQDDDLD